MRRFNLHGEECENYDIFKVLNLKLAKFESQILESIERSTSNKRGLSDSESSQDEAARRHSKSKKIKQQLAKKRTLFKSEVTNEIRGKHETLGDENPTEKSFQQAQTETSNSCVWTLSSTSNLNSEKTWPNEYNSSSICSAD